MERQLKEIIKILKKRNWAIGVMESCTGGAIINSITNIPGASGVFRLGKVTYSDEAKIEAGVDEKILESYGVYSIEVAKEMARKIKGEIGVGVTGNLNFPRIVYIAVRVGDKIESEKVSFTKATEYLNKIEDRKRMKREVIDKVWEMVIEELEK